RLGPDPFAERTQVAPRPAVRDHAVDPRNGCADAGHLRFSLSTATDHAEGLRALAREVPRSNRARSAGAQTAEMVRCDDGDELGPVDRKERYSECSALGEAGVRLDAGVTELEVGCSHVCQSTFLEPQSPPGRDLDGPGGHPVERGFDRLDRVGGRQQLLDVAFRQEERHTSSVPSATTIRLPSIVTTDSQGTASGRCVAALPTPRCSRKPRRPTTIASTLGRLCPISARRSRILPRRRPDWVSTIRPRSEEYVLTDPLRESCRAAVATDRHRVRD